MKLFADLFEKIDSTTSTNRKIEYLVEYFRKAAPADMAWAIYFLTGRRQKRLISSADLRGWALEHLQMPEWLFEEARIAVGDTAETIALLLRPGEGNAFDLSLAAWVEQEILPLVDRDKPAQRDRVLAWWHNATEQEIFIINKLLTGGLRVGVSQTLVEKALANWAALPVTTIAHRLMGEWQPTPDFVETLRAEDSAGEGVVSRPYPFYLASPLDESEPLGDVNDWILEWKWDGIRAQIVRRGSDAYIWSRGEELISERFPELRAVAQRLPSGTVLDGEILAFRDGAPLPFSVLQTRIARKKLSAASLVSAPVVFMVYDCLELEGNDLRDLPLTNRREHLENVIRDLEPTFYASKIHAPRDWDEARQLREKSRAQNVEGLMLKRKGSPYRVGRRRGDWWKWKVNPYSVDAVLFYAQAGSGRRANLFTDYTFAVWRENELIPVAKAYSGLTDSEIDALDRWIRANTLERFGPVRRVKPEQVFELAFEGIAKSSRHKSGVALRFPRILRWRLDKQAADADTLSRLEDLLRVAP